MHGIVLGVVVLLTEPELPEHWGVSGWFDVSEVSMEVDASNLPLAIPSWDVTVQTPTDTRRLTPSNSTLSYRESNGANLVAGPHVLEWPASGVTSHDQLVLEGQNRLVLWNGSGALTQEAVVVVDLSSFGSAIAAERVGPSSGYVVARVPEASALYYLSVTVGIAYVIAAIKAVRRQLSCLARRRSVKQVKTT